MLTQNRTAGKPPDNPPHPPARKGGVEGGGRAEEEARAGLSITQHRSRQPMEHSGTRNNVERPPATPTVMPESCHRPPKTLAGLQGKGNGAAEAAEGARVLHMD